MQNVDWVAERKETPRKYTARRRKRSSSTRRDAAEQPRKLQVPRKTMSPRLDNRIINIRGVRGEEGVQEPWHP